MKKLSEEELKSVQKAIIAKEISVMELLAEIYDHYVTHLESLPKEDFSLELRNLESKWTYDYCQKIQKEFNKNINSSIRSFQWRLTKSYFTWPKLMITFVVFSRISRSISNSDNHLLFWSFNSDPCFCTHLCDKHEL